MQGLKMVRVPIAVVPSGISPQALTSILKPSENRVPTLELRGEYG